MKKRKKAVTGKLNFGKGKHGGRRDRAGRKKRSRRVHHAKREEFSRDSVVHATISFRSGLANLRCKKVAKAIWRAITEFRQSGSVTEDEFRLIVLSIQRDHLHLGVEAESSEKLSNAIQRLKQRIQATLQRLWGITGTIYAGRFHMRVAKSALEVRRLFSYILGNGRHHGSWKEASTDPYSTGFWFEGWHWEMQFAPPCEPESIVSKARSWFARIGWRRAGRKGLLHYTEVALPKGSRG